MSVEVRKMNSLDMPNCDYYACVMAGPLILIAIPIGQPELTEGPEGISEATAMALAHDLCEFYNDNEERSHL